jgi:serine/threonine-protein phosphatase 2A activator
MASTPSIQHLERLDPHVQHLFFTPIKRINDGEDLQFFHTSKAYRDLTIWLLQLNRSMFPDGDVDETYSKTVESIRDLISKLVALIDQAPPETGLQRFGNVAFRTWFNLVEESADDLLESHVISTLGELVQPNRLESQAGDGTLRNELKVYLLGSFGSAQRLDYGTGHELSFLAFLGALWKLGAFENGEERAIVLGLIQP